MKKRRIVLIYSLLLLVFVGTSSFALFNYNGTKKYVLDSVERETDELLNNFTLEVNRYSMERIAELQLMADHIPYLIDKGEDVTLFLHNQNEIMSYFAGIGFITPEGEIRAADGTRFPAQQKESFERAITGEKMFSDVFALNQDPTQKVTAISVPVVNLDGTIIGVLSGVVNMSNIISELAEESNLPGAIFLLKDREVLFSSHNEENFEELIPSSEDFLDVVDENTKGSWNPAKEQMRFIKYQRTWNEWVVVVDSSTNPGTNEIIERLWQSILLVLSALVVIGIICFYLIQLERREKIQLKLDLLTGIGNRLLLEENLISKLRHEPKRVIALFFIKLDRFPDINDRLGYHNGDQMLFAISKKLKELPGKRTIYRVGNEDFVIKSYLETVEEQCQFATSISNVLELPVRIGQEGPVGMTASIGVRASAVGDTMECMMQDVMYASHEASKNGGNQFVYFTEQLAKESERHRLFANNLDLALENGEFYLVYQPIYSVTMDRIVSFETLLRWNSPVLGEVGPADFIPLLEGNDSIVKVGRWLIREVALQIIRWEQEGYKDFSVTLNISIKQLQHDNFLSDVREILKETFVKPNKLVFEVTESIVVQDIEATTKILETLNYLGIKTAIDDFGTGYSSLSILKLLPFQYMKVDRAFVMEVLSDGGESQAILKGILEIANGLEMTTILEGVETIEQLLLLKEMGVHRIQGYYFSKPVAPEVAVEFLNKEKLLESKTNL